MENTAHDHHKSSVGPSRGEDEARNSDSGDSVFFTQKTLPEAVRSGRLPLLGSACTQEGPPEREDDMFASSSSSSSEEEESRTKRKKRRRRVLKMPSCRFSFLSERKGQPNSLLRVKIKKLHSYMIGGYMKHVQKLWECYERGEDIEASLPTVDVEEEELSPLSEDEKDEPLEDEDIKVVERKLFATSIKAKSSKPWCASKAKSVKKRNLRPALNGSPGQQQKTLPKVSTSESTLKETPSAAMETSSDEDPLCGETESQGSSDAKTGERPREQNRSDESTETLGPESHTQGDGDPHTEVLHLDEQSCLGNAKHQNRNLSQSDVNDALCLKKRRKNKEDEDVCKGVKQENKQDGTEGQQEEELLSPLKDVNIKTLPKSILKKKKPASKDGRQDNGSVEGDSVSSSKTQDDWKKQKIDSDVDGGGGDPAAEPPTDKANVQKTINNKKKHPNVTSDYSESPTKHDENPGAPQETPGSLLTKPKFTKRKDKIKHSNSAGENLNFSNDNATNTDSSSQTQIVDTPDTVEDNEKVIKQKEEQAPELKTKKKRLSSEDGRQDDGSVVEASVSSSKTQAGWKKQKNNTDVDGGRTDPAAEPPNDEANVQKTKNNKIKDPNVTSGLCGSPAKHHIDNVEAPQETSSSLLTEPKFTERKDKMKHSASADEDVNFSNDATNTDSTSQTKKADMSDAAEDDEKVDNRQKTEQDPKLKTKKKKKKRLSSEDSRQDNGSVEEDSVSSSKTQDDWKKQKIDSDVDGGGGDPAAEPPTDKANVQKTINNKKKHPNVTSDYSESPTKHDENAGAPQETPGSLLTKSKFTKRKDKIKHSNSAGENLNFSNDNATNTDSSSQTQIVDTPDTAEDNEKVIKQKEEQAPELKTKKKRLSSEDGRQDDGSVVEASVSSSKTQAGWKKQKNNTDVDGGRTDPAAEPPTDEANVQKTKNRKIKDPNVTSDLCGSPAKHYVENAKVPHETELSFTKIKNKKKKHSATAGKDVTFCNDTVTNTDSTSQRKMVDLPESAEEDKQKEEQAPELKTKKKKKKKSACAGDGVTFCNNNATKTVLTSQQKMMVDISDSQKVVNKQKEEQAPELKAKKKKNNWSAAKWEDTGVQGNYSAFVQKGKNETSSFLAADEEENGAEERHESSESAAETLHISAADLAANSAENAESSERLKHGTRTKKKKKKKSAVQESVGGETGFKEPKGTPAVEVNKKRKCERSGSELTSPTSLTLEESQTDPDVPLKKKKKKKDKVPATASEDAESEASTLLNSDSQKKTFKEKIEKAENKLSLAKKSSAKPAESETSKSKQTGSTDFNQGSKAPPLSLKPIKHKKRKLFDASQDFLSDF